MLPARWYSASHYAAVLTAVTVDATATMTNADARPATVPSINRFDFRIYAPPKNAPRIRRAPTSGAGPG